MEEIGFEKRDESVRMAGEGFEMADKRIRMGEISFEMRENYFEIEEILSELKTMISKWGKWSGLEDTGCRL
jgi:hypothetical protein